MFCSLIAENNYCLLIGFKTRSQTKCKKLDANSQHDPARPNSWSICCSCPPFMMDSIWQSWHSRRVNFCNWFLLFFGRALRNVSALSSKGILIKLRNLKENMAQNLKTTYPVSSFSHYILCSTDSLSRSKKPNKEKPAKIHLLYFRKCLWVIWFC